jgi:hypothetical protein
MKSCGQQSVAEQPDAIEQLGRAIGIVIEESLDLTADLLPGASQAMMPQHLSLERVPEFLTKTKLTQGQGAISVKRWDVSS